MGVMNSETTILSAVFTRLGRQRLLEGGFNITKWSVADDEISYGTLNAGLSGDGILTGGVVFDPSTDESHSMKFKILQSVDNYNEFISSVVLPKQVPMNEYALVYTQTGTTNFTLGDFNNEEFDITFSLSRNRSLQLSNSFIIDASAFWKYNNAYFDFTPTSPVGFSDSTSLTSNYWYIADLTYRVNDTPKPVIVGLSSQFKTPGTVDLANFTNDHNASAIAFRLTMNKNVALQIYQYMATNQVGSITAPIQIYNADPNIVPQTSFYGANATYRSIAATINITISL